MHTFTLLHSSLSPFSDLCRQPGGRSTRWLANYHLLKTDLCWKNRETGRDDWQGLHELEGPCLRAAAERSRLIKIDRRSDSLSLSQRHSSGELAVVLIFPTAALVFKGLCAEIDSWALLFFKMCYSVDKSTPPHQQQQRHSWVKFLLALSQRVQHGKQAMRQTKGSS